MLDPCAPSDLQFASNERSGDLSYRSVMDEAASDTPLAAALSTVGDRWTLQIVGALLEGPARFGDLEREVRQ